jgi:hypothetical protein
MWTEGNFIFVIAIMKTHRNDLATFGNCVGISIIEPGKAGDHAIGMSQFLKFPINPQNCRSHH